MTWYPLEIRHTAEETAEQQSYDTIYASRGIGMRDSFYLWFLAQVPRCGERLLDVSCGAGKFLHFARQAGFATYGIDFSRVALQQTQRSTAAPAVALSNAQYLPFADNSFDVVTNIGSLEHYFDPASGVREMARVLRPGGVAVVLLPNAFGLFGNLTHVWRTGEIYDDGQPLQRYATRLSWQRLLEQNGLSPRRTIAYELETPRTLSDLTWMMQRPWKVLRLLAAPLVPLNLGNMLIFFCHK